MLPHIGAVPLMQVEDVYRLDPLSHLDAGHVIIRDIETRRPVPFRPYDHEVELLDAWINMELLDRGLLQFRNVHEEKSRQMGITWTCAWAVLWALMYWPVSLLCQHVDLARIDDGGQRSTHESLFGKVRYMARMTEELYRRLNPDGSEGGWPEWQRPLNYLHFKQEPEHMVVNQLTGGYIVGRGQEDDPARGGTYDAILADEFARIRHDTRVQESYVSACPTGRLYNSTPFGEENVFAQLRTQRPADMVFLRHHWSIHPLYGQGRHVAGEKADCPRCEGVHAYKGKGWSAQHPERAHRFPGQLTSPWKDAMDVKLLDEESIAQELDISYARSLTARVYPEFSEDIHVLPDIPYDDNVQIQLSWDYGYAPSFTSVGIWQDAVDTLRKIGEVEVTEHTPELVARAVRDTCLNLGIPAQELEPRFSRQIFAVGDPAGEARELGSGESLVVQYRKQGFEIISRRLGVEHTIISMKRLLLGVPKPVRYSKKGCPLTIQHMKQNRRETDRYGKVKASRTIRNDEHNHMPRADAYYVSYKYPAPQVWEQDDARGGFVADEDLPYMRLTRAEAAAMMREQPGDGGLHPNMRL